MTKPREGRLGKMRGRLESLPLYALLLIGGLIVAGTSAGGYYAYKTYDYIEHDNEFCFSCHLMQDPYELFAQSAHRGLGCKACHQPNMLERSSMGVTGIVFDPDTLSVHAEVPNQLCADCHIDGDPEQWTLIASSAGHRVHLESEDSVLQGLQCVECHSSSLHQFAAADETCAQSGCHTESDVELGAMGDLTIHCAACHAFSAPVPDVDQAGALAALAPDEDTCLSCHAMRLLVDMPDPDPHERACAACHNPHEQQTPAQAVESCASAGCHTEAVDLTPFHVGLEEEVLTDCLYCHQAHDFQVDGSDCTACHVDIMDDDPTVVASALEPGVGLLHSWGYPIPGWPQQVPQELDFLHSEHASVDCASCHESVERHGEVTVTTVNDCRSCHHTVDQGEIQSCADCHQESESTGDPYALTRTMDFSTGLTVQRALPFDHDAHPDLDCASCHTDGLALSASAVDCASCHEDHHEPAADCMSCHQPTGSEAHVVETAHVTCSGAGCHTDLPFEGLPRTNTVCLACHQDLVDHRPGGECAECHALPEVGG